MTIDYLPLQRITALHAAEIHAAVAQVIDSGWYLHGEATSRFEGHYAHYIGTRHCVGVGNGLDALTLMLRACVELGQLREDDEVIVPANTFIATILAITANGLKPVLVEPSMETLEMDDELLERAVTPRTRAVMLVHLYGRCAYTERVADVCRRHGLLLFEDNAQAQGCAYRGRATGSLGYAAAHSFYPGKNLGALGDAGAVTTDDERLAEVVRSLGNYGSRQKYVYDYQGRNSRLDELQAAVLDVKLRHLDADNARRRQIAAYYLEKVDNPAAVTLPTPSDSVYHIFPVLSPCRDELQRYLARHGVATQIHYPVPPHRQRCYAAWSALSLPVTELISQQELSLPCHQAMTTEEADRVVDLLNSFTPAAAPR